jgi:hypothetical protein
LTKKEQIEQFKMQDLLFSPILSADHCCENFHNQKAKFRAETKFCISRNSVFSDKSKQTLAFIKLNAKNISSLIIGTFFANQPSNDNSSQFFQR